MTRYLLSWFITNNGINVCIAQTEWANIKSYSLHADGKFYQNFKLEQKVIEAKYLCITQPKTLYPTVKSSVVSKINLTW